MYMQRKMKLIATLNKKKIKIKKTCFFNDIMH